MASLGLDNTWVQAQDKAIKAGRLLGEVLENRVQGQRPVVLVRREHPLLNIPFLQGELIAFWDQIDRIIPRRTNSPPRTPLPLLPHRSKRPPANRRLGVPYFPPLRAVSRGMAMLSPSRGAESGECMV